MLQVTYSLNDDTTKVMIGSRLKGKAINWFHSKPEHIGLAVGDLLAELRSMFSYKQNKVTIRKQFEERVWKKDEGFSDYFHEKLILANHVPVADDEIIDYIIDGIPDPVLKDQARIQGFRSRASLEAFQRVTLRQKG